MESVLCPLTGTISQNLVQYLFIDGISIILPQMAAAGTTSAECVSARMIQSVGKPPQSVPVVVSGQAQG